VDPEDLKLHLVICYSGNLSSQPDFKTPTGVECTLIVHEIPVVGQGFSVGRDIESMHRSLGKYGLDCEDAVTVAFAGALNGSSCTMERFDEVRRNVARFERKTGFKVCKLVNEFRRGLVEPQYIHGALIDALKAL